MMTKDLQYITVLQQQLAEQQAQIVKLEKINSALIQRVEAGQPSLHSPAQAPYTAFQHAAILANEVRQRTTELSSAYDELRRSISYSESLKASENWIRTITDHVPAMIAHLNADLLYQFTNKPYDEFYGAARGSLLHKALHQAHGTAGAARLQPYIQQVLSGRTVVFEIEETDAYGNMRFLLKTYVPHFSESDSVTGFFVLNRDITERKKTSEALRQANQLLEQRVHQRTAALSELNLQLRAEIDERLVIEQQLLDAKMLAEQANQSKSRFLAAVSHDVLQPLNAAKLFTGALDELALPKAAARLSASVGRALNDVSDLLQTLVDMSRLDAGLLQPQRQPVKLGELMQYLSEEFSHQAQQRQLSFTAMPAFVVVDTDPALLSRILRNLLTNALRYTAPGGQILFGCRRRGKNIELQIVDTGCGISQQDIPAVFREFHRLAPTETSKENGLGLGLAIVEKLSGLLQHPLKVHSVVGQGSVFSVVLPLTVIAPQDIATDRRMPVQHNSSLKTLWVIDNDEQICQAMKHLLSGWGYNVKTATGIADTLVGPVDMLLVDYHLGAGLTGIRLVEQIFSQIAPVPVLIITADHSAELSEDLRLRGFNLLHKPVRPLQLKTMLRHILINND